MGVIFKLRAPEREQLSLWLWVLRASQSGLGLVFNPHTERH